MSDQRIEGCGYSSNKANALGWPPTASASHGAYQVTPPLDAVEAGLGLSEYATPLTLPAFARQPP